MVCIYCGNETIVKNSRPQKRSNRIWRRRKCTTCHADFTTHESIDLSSALVVGSKNQAPQPFLDDKLYADLLIALQDHQQRHSAARELSYTITRQLLKDLKSPDLDKHYISQVCAATLKRFDQRAYLRYLAEHPSVQPSKL